MCLGRRLLRVNLRIPVVRLEEKVAVNNVTNLLPLIQSKEVYYFVYSSDSLMQPLEAQVMVSTVRFARSYLVLCVRRN